MCVEGIKSSPVARYLVVLGVWISVLGSFAAKWSELPATLAVHFDAAGKPNGYMSREQNFSFVLVLLTLFSVNALVAREYLRIAKTHAKRVIGAIMDAALVIIASAHYFILQFNTGATASFSFAGMGAAAAGAALYGWFIESGGIVRPSGASERDTAPQASGLNIKKGSVFYLEERGNPRWWNLLCISPVLLIGVEFLLLDASNALNAQVVKPLLFGFALLQCVLLPFINGFSFVAYSSGIQVRLGIFGIKLKQIPWDAVRSVSVVKEFSPFEKFLGLGWRINRKQHATGYVLSSGEAVKIETGDWSYYLVMPNAEPFADVANQAAEARRVRG